jgi:hypothetical protein
LLRISQMKKLNLLRISQMKSFNYILKKRVCVEREPFGLIA